ncbi:MAG: isoleucine--tRNA ligase [Candidatus Andersenbacteria bacterium]
MSTASQSFSLVSSRVNSDELEREILSYWETAKIFEQSLEQTKGQEQFTFYDGPPYATGKPHYGHVLQSAIKDTVLRYKTMQGYYVPRRVGWDCHGLPIETLVEKELGFKTKKDIEAFGIEKFNQACRDVVFRYIDDFTQTLRRMGRWADYEGAYATLNQDYMESEWWVFQQLWQQELVYKAFRSTPYCIRCATPLSNFEVSSNYKDTVDTSIYVGLPVKEHDGLSLLVWTTTPWTLPGNAAVAINPELAYVTYEHEGKQYVVAKERVQAVFGESGNVVHEWNNNELLALTYEPLYSFLPADNAYRVVAGEHVEATEGTGLVHTAPAFGEEDAAVGQRENLPILRTVDTNGQFIPEVTPWAGENIFAANAKIIADLKDRQLLFKEESYTHSYPFCWRCDNPLIYYALDTWFIKVTDLKERMLQNNEDITWVPEHVKHGRFAKGIESAPDWAVSRNRYWSVPLPIWECDACKHRICLGSSKELKEKSGATDIPDLHRPFIDEYTWACEACGKGSLHRVPEVLDVWFDSASMPYAQWHYPFENKEKVETSFPADFIAESIEMTRAWFYVLHVVATALTTKDIGIGKDQPAFKNAIASGIIFAEDGQKLSKKLKNYPEIEPTLEKYGADVVRFYLLTSSHLGEPYRFSEKELQHMQRNTYATLWNVYSFFVQYANTHGWQPGGEVTNSTHILDEWIIARLQQLEHQVTNNTNEYQLTDAARLFIGFIDDLSNWYVRRSRPRFQRPASEQEKHEAFATLYATLTRLCRLMAPFMPFVTEAIYRNLSQETVPSVHLAKLEREAPEPDGHQYTVIENMSDVRAAVAAGLALRAKAGIKVRQPLSQLVVAHKEMEQWQLDMIRDEVNVKECISGDIPSNTNYVASESEFANAVQVALNTAITPELELEGIAREIIRHGQVLRREAKYALNDRIILIAVTDDEKIQQALQMHRDLIMNALQSDELVEEKQEADAFADVKVKPASLYLGVKKP